MKRTANAVRAIGRMNALRLGSMRKSKPKGGSTSSEKSPSPTSPTSETSSLSDPLSPSSLDPSLPTSPSSPTQQTSSDSPNASTGVSSPECAAKSDDSARGSDKAAALQGNTNQESLSIDNGIDQDAASSAGSANTLSNTANAAESALLLDTTVPCSHEATQNGLPVSPTHLDQVPCSSSSRSSSRDLAISALDSDVENDSGLDLSLDQNATGRRSTSLSNRSSQESVGEGRNFPFVVDVDIRAAETTHQTRREGVEDYVTPPDTNPSEDKDKQIVNDIRPVTSPSLDVKSDISVCSDASEDTTGSSDQGVNMERYLFDPSKGVKNQAAKWEGRTDSPERKSKGLRAALGKDKSQQQQQQVAPQQAPVFRQKFRHCEVDAGAEARFECCVDGNPTPDIIWYRNGKRVQESERFSILDAEDVHTLVVKDISKEDQGTYMCEARSPAGKARCSARLAVNQHSTNSEQEKRTTQESKEAKQNNTGRRFWQFSSPKNRDQKDKLATPEKAPSFKSPSSSKSSSVFHLPLDRKGPLRATHTGCHTTSDTGASPTATDTNVNALTPTRKSAVDKLKERAEVFTQQYEAKKAGRQSLADKSPRRSQNISEYLQRYTRSASADRSSSFSIGSSSGRRSSNTSDKDSDPQQRPRLATYATMIRSTQSIGALTAKFEQGKTNGAKPGASTLPRKDLKYAANLAAKKALFSSGSPSNNGTTTDSSATKAKTKEHVTLSPRASVPVVAPSTSSLRSKFESGSDSERESAPFTRASQARVSTGRLSYLDKIESKERDSSQSSSSSFNRSTSARHSTIGVVKPSKKDTNYDAKQSIKSSNKDRARNSSYTSSATVTASSNNQQTFISRYETVINSDSESSIASTSSSMSDRKPRTSPSSSISEKVSRTSSSYSDKPSRSSSSSVSSRYEIRSPVTEKSPSFIKKPQKVTATEGESATFSCAIDGEPKPDVKWQFRGKPLSDEGRHEIYEEKGIHYMEIFDLNPKDAGLYTCRIVNTAGRSSALAELVVSAKPKRPPFFLQKLSDCEVHEPGASGRLQCRLEGEPLPEVTWLKEQDELREGARVHFERSANGIYALIIDDVTEDDDAIYTCVAKNKHGEVTSSAELIVELDLPSKSDVNSITTDLSLHIDEDDIRPSSTSTDFAAPEPAAPSPSPDHIAPQFVKRPNSLKIDESKSARFTCTLSGLPLPSVTWAKDDLVLRDEGRYEIYDERGEFVMEIFDVGPEDSGMYTVTAENSSGKVATGAQLTVNRAKIPEKPLPAPYTANSLSSTDVRSDEVYSASEDIASIKSEQIPAPAPAQVQASAPVPVQAPAPSVLAKPARETAGPPPTTPTDKFQPPSRIPPEFLALPSPQTLVEPNSAKFSCRVVGDPKPSVTWSRNGIVLGDTGRFEIYEEKDDFVLEIFDTTTVDSGVYVCTATNLAGQKTAEAMLTVQSPKPTGISPEFLEKINNVSVKDGDSAKFVCKLSGTPPPTVHWYYRSQEIVGSDEVYELYHEGETASLCLPEVLPEDEGEYSCVIRNDQGETKCTATLKVTVTPALSNNETAVDSVVDVEPKETKPEFVQKLKDVQAIDGNPLSLPVRIKGAPDAEVKWFFNDEPIKEDDDFKFVRDGDRYSLVIAEVYPDDAGVYTCKVSNAAGTIECAAKVFVQETDLDGSPPRFLQKPRSVNIDEGSSVTLSCKVDGEPLPSVTWVKDGRAIEAGRRFKIESSGISGTTRSLNVPTVLATDAGSYTCELRNEHGVEQCSVTVVVKALEEEQTDFRSLLKSRPRLQNISNSPNNVSSDKSDVDQVDFRHVLTRHVNTRKRPVFTRPLTDAEVREGDSVTFECHVDAVPPPTVVWTMNKKEIKESKYFQMSYTDDGVAKLLIAEAFPEDEGDYTCTVSNNAGQVSTKAELTVLDEDQTTESQNTVTEESTSLTNPRMNDPTRCVIESDCTHDKVASTFNVRLSKVFNGTTPSTEIPEPVIEEQVDFQPQDFQPQDTNSNNNNNKDFGVDLLPVRSELAAAAPVDIALSYQPEKQRSAPAAAPLKQDSFSAPESESSSSSSRLDRTSSLSSTTPSSVDSNMDNDSPSAPKEETPVVTTEPPSFPEPLKDTAVLEESSAMLKCRFAGDPEPDILWYRDGVELRDDDRKYTLDFPDDDVAMLVVRDAAVDDAGVYTCKAVSSAGTVETTAHIIVEAPARIKDAPRTVQITAGSDLSVTCEFVAQPEPDIVAWNKYRKPVKVDERTKITDTESSTTLTVQNATHADGGKYTLVVENDLGSDEAAIYISVIDKPEPPVGKPIASHVTGESLTLSWTGPGYDGGIRILGYVVEMRTEADGDDGWTQAGVEPNTSHTFDNLKPEMTYFFRVSAQNDLGVSDPGQESDPILTVVEKPVPRWEPTKAEDEQECEFRHVTINPDTDFSERYQIKEVLGKGRFGTVHKCLDKTTGKPYAAKMIKTIKAADKAAVKNEVDIMNRLHHAKLLQCLDAFESPKQMIMVLEIINGGELFERVIDDDFNLTESDVIEFTRQICAGVQHMHSQNILHLDLKPENILCMDKTGSRIKLIDFGLARVFDPQQNTKVLFGTPEFVAPEVINYEAIGFTTDMWSVGVVCYILLSGLSPFMGDNDAETLSNVTMAEWDFEDDAFDAISEDAKVFIESLLVKEKEDRLAADECLEHKWLQFGETKKNKISTAKLKNFVARRRWQKTATAVRAIGRMASLSLFGSHKKLHLGDANGGVAKPPSPNLPSPQEGGSKATAPIFPTTPTKSASHPEPVKTGLNSSAPEPVKAETKPEIKVNDRIQDEKDSNKDDEQNGVAKIITTPKVTDNGVNDQNKKGSEVDDDEDDDDVSDVEDDVDGPGKDMNSNVPGAPHFTKEIIDCDVFEGDSARFDCKVEGEPEPDIKWLQDGVEIEESARFIFDCDDDGTYSLIIRRIQEDDEGEYCVKAVNSKGEASCEADLLVEGF